MANSDCCAAPKRKIVGGGIEAWGGLQGVRSTEGRLLPGRGLVLRSDRKGVRLLLFRCCGWRGWLEMGKMMGLKATKSEKSGRCWNNERLRGYGLFPLPWVCMICWPISGWGTFWGRSRSSELGPESGDGNDVGVQRSGDWRLNGARLGKGKSRRRRAQCRQPRCNFLSLESSRLLFLSKVVSPFSLKH